MRADQNLMLEYWRERDLIICQLSHYHAQNPNFSLESPKHGLPLDSNSLLINMNGIGGHQKNIKIINPSKRRKG